MYSIFLAAGPSANASLIQTFVMMALVFVLMYFMLIRPQKKREKQVVEMRNSINIGDGVTTIGGIIGRVVTIKDDTVVIETGTERTRLRIKRWAVQEVEKLTVE